MKLFGKRKVVFETPDRALYQQAKELLRQSDVELMESGARETEAPVCGCGARLDPRNFGAGGPVDRNLYYLAVRPEDIPRAQEVLRALTETR
jgi:hypothetical protein